MAAIDLTSHIPLYVQIMRYLEEEIEKGTYKEGDQIPSETSLAADFGVSRITVTNAILRMVQEGTLYRIQGKGTYVANKPKMEHRLSTLVSFTADMQSRGLTAQSMLIGFDLITPPERVREKLGLTDQDLTWRIKRVRYADQEPMAIQTAYLPQSIFPSLAREQVKQGSLYKVLQEQFAIEMNEAEEQYRVFIIRNEEEAALLNVPYESPSLYCVRVASLKNQQKFEYTESILRGDRYMLSVKINI